MIPHLVDDFSIVRYVDDTILLMDHYLDKARNLKPLLGAFHELPILIVIFQKSKHLCFGEAANPTLEYVRSSDAGLGSSRFGI